MKVVKAKVSGKVPKCPNCGHTYHPRVDKIISYGDDDNGFWFIFKCQNCSGKKVNIFVKFFTDKNFIVERR